MRAKWVEAGLVTRDEMQTNCCYALQDKTWVHDPDGNQWEAFVVLQDNLAESPVCCTADVTAETARPVMPAGEKPVPVIATSCCG
jgi:hypothetical protein